MAPTQRRSSGSGSKQARRKPAARKPATPQTQSGPPSLTAAHFKGFIAGAAAGVLIGAGGVAYLTKVSNDPNNDILADITDSASSESSEPKPRFDFYTVLPNQNLDLGAGVEPAELTTAMEDSARYLLQAGSFRLRKDADRRRGELALLGLEASIEESRSDNGLWFRVYIGPFDSRSAMAQARSITAQQSIDTLLLRRPASP